MKTTGKKGQRRPDKTSRNTPPPVEKSADALLEQARGLLEKEDLEAATEVAVEAAKASTNLAETIATAVAMVNAGVALNLAAEAELKLVEAKLKPIEAEIKKIKGLPGLEWKVEKLMTEAHPLYEKKDELNDQINRGLESATSGLRTLQIAAQGSETPELTPEAAQWAAQVKAAEAEDLEKARAEAAEALKEFEAFKTALEEVNQILEAHRALGIEGRLAPDLSFVQERVEAAQSASTSHEIEEAARQAIAWLHGRFDHERQCRIGNAAESLEFILQAIEDIAARRAVVRGDDPDADKAIRLLNSAIAEFNEGRFRSNVRNKEGANFYTVRIDRLLNPLKRDEEHSRRPGQRRHGQRRHGQRRHGQRRHGQHLAQKDQVRQRRQRAATGRNWSRKGKGGRRAK